MKKEILKSKIKIYKDDYYNIEKDIITNTINIRIGGRGTGKTCSAFYKCVNDFLNEKKKFVIIRRQQTDAYSLFSDIVNFFPNDTFSFDYDNKSSICTLFINDELCGYLLSLSCSVKYKSHYFDCENIVFDEFIKASTEKRLSDDESFTFFELVETIVRDRTNVTILMLSNATKISNDYFIMWHINIDELKHDTLLNINEVVNIKLLSSTDEYLKIKSNTLTFKASKGTQFFDYAYNNNFNSGELIYFVKENKSNVKPSKDDFYFSFKSKLFHVNEKFINEINFDKIPLQAKIYSSSLVTLRNTKLIDESDLRLLISENLSTKVFKRKIYFSSLNTAVLLSDVIFGNEV